MYSIGDRKHPASCRPLPEKNRILFKHIRLVRVTLEAAYGLHDNMQKENIASLNKLNTIAVESTLSLIGQCPEGVGGTGQLCDDIVCD